MSFKVTAEEIEQFKKDKTVGIIGLGDMGIMYAQRFSEAGWNVVGCDQEANYERFREEYSGQFEVVKNGHFVSRMADYTIYSVEAENIDKIVQMYGPSTKMGAVVGGQTSCKEPEIKAFERFLPSDVEIVSVHSLHGPNVDPTGQPLVIINHRTHSPETVKFVLAVVDCLHSKQEFLTWQEHDKTTADTQAATHAAFLSMGLAWKRCNFYPWEAPRWTGGLENAKINISLRIYSNKWHVYAGLAITNPAAHEQLAQYAKSTEQLFTLMIQSNKEELKERIYKAKQAVFGHLSKEHKLLLDDDLLQQYSLSKNPPGERQPNSQLSLLAIVDSWSQLGIVPYDHLICTTPLFRIFLGVSEYLFCTPGMLDQCIDDAVKNTAFRQDDLNFVMAAKEWATIVNYGDYNLYRMLFENTQAYFEHMFPQANKVGNEMIKTILKRAAIEGDK